MSGSRRSRRRAHGVVHGWPSASQSWWRRPWRRGPSWLTARQRLVRQVLPAKEMSSE